MCAWARVQACKTFNPVTVHLSTEQEKARMSWVIRVVQRRPLSCLLKMSTNPKQNRCLIQLCSHCACVGVAVGWLVCVCVRAEVWVFHKVLERKVTTKNNATCCHQCEAFYSKSRHVCSCRVCVYLSMVAVHVSVQRAGAGGVWLAVTLILQRPWTHRMKSALQRIKTRDWKSTHTQTDRRTLHSSNASDWQKGWKIFCHHA